MSSLQDPFLAKLFAGGQGEREAKILQISAVLEEQVEPMYVCDFDPFLLIQFHGYDFLKLFSVLMFSPDVILTAHSSLHLAFFAFLFNSPKHRGRSFYIYIAFWRQSSEQRELQLNGTYSTSIQVLILLCLRLV